MAPFYSYPRRRKGPAHSRRAIRPKARPRRPERLLIELLEDRILPTTVNWLGGSGDWATPSNWSNYNPTLGTGGPGPGDDAVIDVAGISVTHNAGNDTVNSLTVNDGFILSGGTLTIAGNLQVENGNLFTLAGGMFATATVAAGTTLTGSSTPSTLNGVTLDGTLDLGSTFAPRAIVTGGLTLNGTILLGSADGINFGTVSFAGTQMLSGSGSILLGGSSSNTVTLPTNTSLTVSAGITIDGQSGTLVRAFWEEPQAR